MFAVMPDSFLWLFAAVAGCCLGSFAGVVTYRLPRKISVIMPPSYCPECGSRLKWRDMIPVISWLLLLGRSRCCGKAINVRYIIMEVSCAALFLLMVRHTEGSLVFLPLWGLAFSMICISIVDWDTMEIPDGLVMIIAVSGVAWVTLSYGTAGWQNAIIGALAGAISLIILNWLVWLIVKQPGLGYGDVKLMAAAGLFLGWQGVYAAFFTAFITGGVYGGYLIATGKAERRSYLAFAPFLSLGILVAFLFVTW